MNDARLANALLADYPMAQSGIDYIQSEEMKPHHDKHHSTHLQVSLSLLLALLRLLI